jgi:hypothetical protein
MTFSGRFVVWTEKLPMYFFIMRATNFRAGVDKHFMIFKSAESFLCRIVFSKDLSSCVKLCSFYVYRENSCSASLKSPCSKSQLNSSLRW